MPAENAEPSIKHAESSIKNAEIRASESEIGTRLARWRNLTAPPEALGTFAGVFRPTLLMMLGVMVFLREGWVVGNAGVLGAGLIVLLTFIISGLASLSLSSLSTNARAGDGGIIRVVGRALGFEAGWTIGIPSYLGRTFSCGIYLYGFSEAWQYIFPEHPQLLVAFGAFVLVFAAAFVGQWLMVQAHAVALVLALLSIGTIVLGFATGDGEQRLVDPLLWGSFDAVGFWILFAVLFPAGTGIKMGVSFSGMLADPVRSIPRGTLSAIAVGSCLYVLMAFLYGLMASSGDLRVNHMVAVDRSAWGALVLAGIFGITLTVALTTFTAASQTLHSFAEQSALVEGRFRDAMSRWFRYRHALTATAILVLLTLLLGSLNRIAILVTLLFLVTYLIIHAFVFAELRLGMISFRPLFRVPLWVPVSGIAACLLALFAVNPIFSLVFLGLILGLFGYLTLVTRGLPSGMVRSSLGVALADRAFRRLQGGPGEAHERAWKPHLLVPVESKSQLDGTFRFLRVLTEPGGSISVLGIVRTTSTSGEPRVSVAGMADRDLFGPRTTRSDVPGDPRTDPVQASGGTTANVELETLSATTASLRSEELPAIATVIEAQDFLRGVETAARVLRGTPAGPNILLGLAHLNSQETLQGLLEVGIGCQMGVALFYLHPEAALGYERSVNVWVNDQGPTWEPSLRLANLDLSLLLAGQVSRNLGGRLRLSVACADARELPGANAFIDRLIRDARLPAGTEKWVVQGSVIELAAAAPQADIHVLGLTGDVHLASLRMVARRTGSSCLFVRESGRESLLA